MESIERLEILKVIDKQIYKLFIWVIYMKITLINPDYMLYADPPLGLAHLASYVKAKTDFDISILDQLNFNQIERKIKKTKPKVIGFTAVSLNYYKVKQLAEKISKISPDSILVIGGVHITTSPDSFADSPFDFGIRGEGEISFTNFLKSINKGVNLSELKKIKGLLFRDKNSIINNGLSELIEDLDDLPMPARELLNMKYYDLPTILSSEDFEPFGSMSTSRGCPYNCKFCSSSSFWERKIRFFSAERVAEEIELLYKKYKYKKICIYDDIFSINKKRITDLINLLERKKILGKIIFYIYGRADIFDEELAVLLKKLNVVSITFGIETGSQKILTYLKGKRATLEDNLNALILAKKHGIIGDAFFMIGSPHETLEDIKETYNFIKNYCRNNFIIYQVIPFPGTDIWDYAIEEKIISKNYYDKKTKDFVDIDLNLLLSKNISKEEFKEMFDNIKSLYLSENKNILSNKLFSLRLRHLLKFIHPLFLKKSFALRKQFLKRIF